MANLPESPVWHDEIYRLEKRTLVVGGEPRFDEAGNPIGGYSNVPHKQMADRTQWLRERIGEKLQVVEDIDALRLVDPRLLYYGQFLSIVTYGSGQFNDGVVEYYYWDPVSQLPDDGYDVIRPTVSLVSGRWIRITNQTSDDIIEEMEQLLESTQETAQQALQYSQNAAQYAQQAAISSETSEDHAEQAQDYSEEALENSNKAQAWAESSVSPNPLDPTAKSSKSWSEQAEVIVSEAVIDLTSIKNEATQEADRSASEADRAQTEANRAETIASQVASMPEADHIFDLLSEAQTAASSLPDNTLLLVVNDGNNNGYYKVISGVASKTEYQTISKSELDKISYSQDLIRKSEVSKIDMTSLDVTGGTILKSIQSGTEDADIVISNGEELERLDTVGMQKIQQKIRFEGTQYRPEESVSEQIRGNIFTALEGYKAYFRDFSRQFALAEHGIEVDLPVENPGVPGTLWQPAPGVLETVPDPVPWYDGRVVKLGKNQPRPGVFEPPVSILASEDTENRDVQLFRGLPSVEFVPRPGGGGRLWASWTADNTVPAEAGTNYVCLSWSDDYSGSPQWQVWNPIYIYIDGPSPDVRAVDQRIWLSPEKHLHMTAVVEVGGAGNTQACVWHWVCQDPLSDKPRWSRPTRLLTYGDATIPFWWDGRLIMPVYLRESPANPGYPDYVGKWLFEFDRFDKTLTLLGRIPNSPISYQEISVQQLNDGSCICIMRCPQGQYISRSPSGNLQEEYWTEPEPWSALPTLPNAESKATMRVAPSGEMIVIFNNATTRTKMTIAYSLDNGETLEGVTEVQTSSSTYPEMCFDQDGNVIFVWDSTGRTIIRGTVVNINEWRSGNPNPQNFIVN